MATTITGKLNKPANIFQAGESTGFGIRLGVKCRNPKTKEDVWTNYIAVIFAKSAGQIQFYTDALVKDSVVEVSAEQLMVDQFDGDNGPILSIDMLNARLGYVHTGQNQAPQQQQQQQNQGFQQQGFQQNNQQQNQGGFNQNNQQQQQQQNQGFQNSHGFNGQ